MKRISKASSKSLDRYMYGSKKAFLQVFNAKYNKTRSSVFYTVIKHVFWPITTRAGSSLCHQMKQIDCFESNTMSSRDMPGLLL